MESFRAFGTVKLCRWSWASRASTSRFRVTSASSSSFGRFDGDELYLPLVDIGPDILVALDPRLDMGD